MDRRSISSVIAAGILGAFGIKKAAMRRTFLEYDGLTLRLP